MKRGKALKTSIAMLVISAFFVPQIVLAADYYVDFTGGVDSGDCTNPASPCQTFGAAGLAGAAAGDHVNCTGTYDGTAGADITVPWSGALGSPVTIRQWSGQSRPVIDMTANPGAWTNAGITFTGDHVTFDGFEVVSDSLSAGSTNVRATGSTGLTVSNSSIHGAEEPFNDRYGIAATDTVDLAIEGNEIFENNQNMIYGGSDAAINANRIYATSTTSMVGFFLRDTDSPLVSNNYIYGYTDGMALFLGGFWAPPPADAATDTLILNNSFYNNRTCVRAGSAAGTGHQFVDNIVYSDGKNYIGLSDDTDSTSYFANLYSDNNDFYVGATDSVAQYRIGMFWPPTIVDYPTLGDWQGSVFGQDAGSIDGDPLFVDLTPGSEDLDLQEDSPCKDAGISTAPYVTADIYGTSRPEGSAYDIGAYEISQVPRPSAPTGLAVSNITHESAHTTWNASTLATGYDLEYSVNEDMSGSYALSVSGTSADLYGLEDGTTYYVRVRGRYYNGGWITGNWSDKAVFDTLINPPSGLELVYAKAKKAKFAWDLEEGSAADLPANRFILEISARSDFASPIIIENIVSQSYVADQLKTSNHYFARVKTVTAEKESDWSDVIDFRTYPKKPDAKKVVRKGYNSAYLCVKRIPRVKKMRAIILKKNRKGWQRIGKFTLNGHNKTRQKPVIIEMTDLEQGQLYKVRAKGIWTNKNVGTYKGKSSVGITFEL